MLAEPNRRSSVADRLLRRSTSSSDAMSVIAFLKHYGLEAHFKLNIEPNHTTLAGHSYEHDVVMASA